MSTYVRREYPEWSWSFSRDQMFSTCLRRYYYNYYGSHNGWETQAPSDVALAYRLKKLSNIYLVLGDAVHKSAARIVERVLEGRGVPTADEVEEDIRRQLRRVWKSSRDEGDLFLRRPNRVDMLHEFYYGLGLSDEVIAKINQRATRTAEALVASTVWSELVGEGIRLISCEQFDTFSIGDTPVYAVPDLLFVDSQGKWVIVDWKTGEEVEDNKEQVALYALYVRKKHGVVVENISARLEYLNLGTVQELTFTTEELKAVEREALASMEKMQDLLLDPAQNVPLSKEHFPLTSARKLCLWCNFYELCQRELAESVS
ncbi:MAG: PD-(D/E)XK nuclease family protein [Firmicutes bacterium]|nr:PD-(D/E)XK nuclease family protein [Bacillota bacterium]